MDPEILHTCFICPCRTGDEWGFLFVFFPPDICVFFFGYSDLKGSHVSGEKKKKQTEKKIVNGSPGAYGTRVQKFRVYLSKTAWTFGLFAR